VEELSGRYYFPRSARVVETHLCLKEDTLILTTPDETYRFAVGATKLTPPLANLPRKFCFDDGSVFECANDLIDDAWFGALRHSRMEKKVSRLEKSWKAVTVLMLIGVMVGYLTYTQGIPAFSRWVAFQLPQDTQIMMGKQVLTILDKSWLSPTQLSPARQQQVQQEFNALLGFRPDLKALQPALHFRHGGSLGANALAIPDGTIVITDELVELAGDNRIGFGACWRMN
jgi:hypothetical protein